MSQQTLHMSYRIAVLKTVLTSLLSDMVASRMWNMSIHEVKIATWLWLWLRFILGWPTFAERSGLPKRGHNRLSLKIKPRAETVRPPIQRSNNPWTLPFYVSFFPWQRLLVVFGSFLPTCYAVLFGYLFSTCNSPRVFRRFCFQEFLSKSAPELRQVQHQEHQFLLHVVCDKVKSFAGSWTGSFAGFFSNNDAWL